MGNRSETDSKVVVATSLAIQIWYKCNTKYIDSYEMIYNQAQTGSRLVTQEV